MIIPMPQEPKTQRMLTRPLRQSFARRDLPELHRVILPGAMVTKDFRPERLNIHTGEDGTVTHVDFK